MKISLIGYMGSGKTTIGKELAQKLNVEFLDLDELIQNHTQKSIPELFTMSGEIKFRKIEREVLLQTLDSDKNYVLAVGGGTPVYYDNMDLIQQHTTSVYLRSNPRFLAERLILEKSNRPMIAHLNNEDLPEFVAKHLFERRNFYEKADFTLDISSKSVDEITSEIIRHLPDFHLQ